MDASADESKLEIPEEKKSIKKIEYFDETSSSKPESKEVKTKDPLIKRIIKKVRKHPLMFLMLSAAFHAPAHPKVQQGVADLYENITRQNQQNSAEESVKKFEEPIKKSSKKEAPQKMLEPNDEENSHINKESKENNDDEIEDSELIPVQTPEEAEDMLNKIDARLARIDKEKLEKYKSQLRERLKQGEKIPLVKIVFELEKLAGTEETDLQEAKTKQERENREFTPSMPPAGPDRAFFEQLVNSYYAKKTHKWGQASYTDCVNDDKCNCFAREIGIHILVESALTNLPPEQQSRFVQGNIYEKQHTVPAVVEVDEKGQTIRTYVLEKPFRVIEKKYTETGTAFLSFQRFKKSLAGESQTIFTQGDQKQIKPSPRFITEHNQPLQLALNIVGKLRGAEAALAEGHKAQKKVEEVQKQKIEDGVMEVVPADPGVAQAKKVVLRGYFSQTKIGDRNVVNASEFFSPGLETVEALMPPNGEQAMQPGAIYLGDVSAWSQESLQRVFTSKKIFKYKYGLSVEDRYLGYIFNTDIQGGLPENFKKVWEKIQPSKFGYTITLNGMEKKDRRFPVDDLKLLIDGGDKSSNFHAFNFDYKNLTAEEAELLHNYNPKKGYYGLEKLENMSDEVLNIFEKQYPSTKERKYDISAKTYLKIALRNPKILNNRQIYGQSNLSSFSGIPEEIKLIDTEAKIYILAVVHNSFRKDKALTSAYPFAKQNIGEQAADKSFKELIAQAIHELGVNIDPETVLKTLKSDAS